MRKLINSDIFAQELNKNNRILGKINMILSGTDGSIILNNILYPEIERKMISKKKDKISVNIGQAINNGTIILVYNTPDKKLSSIVPFITFTKHGILRVLVNMSDIVQVIRLEDGTNDYSIDDTVNKVYSILVASYLAVSKFTEKDVLYPSFAANAAILWASMFNKPLYGVIGLNNSDRKPTYMYFSIKFFLIYYLNYKEEQAEKVAMSYIKNKNMLLLDMEDKIHDRGIQLYNDGVINFLHHILNNEISGITGVRTKDMQQSINVTSYISNFSQSYGSNALLSLCSFPYFAYTVFSAYAKTGMMRDKSFIRVFDENKQLLNRFLVDMTRD